MSIAVMFARVAAFAAVLMFSHQALAGDAYFTITDANGQSFEVTREVIEKVGTVSYKTTLAGKDDGEHQVRGPLIRDLLKAANVSGQTAVATAIDQYSADIPVKDFTTYDVIAAIELDGKPLTVREMGPVWIVYPVKAAPESELALIETRSVWQLSNITVK